MTEDIFLFPQYIIGCDPGIVYKVEEVIWIFGADELTNEDIPGGSRGPKKWTNSNNKRAHWRQKARSSLVCQWEQKKGKSSLEADSDITVVTWIGGKPSWSNKTRSKRNRISWELFLSVLHFIFKHIGSNEALKRLFLNISFSQNPSEMLRQLPAAKFKSKTHTSANGIDLLLLVLKAAGKSIDINPCCRLDFFAAFLAHNLCSPCVTGESIPQVAKSPAAQPSITHQLETR